MMKFVKKAIQGLNAFLDHLATRLIFCLLLMWFSVEMFIKDMLILAVIYLVLGLINCWIVYNKIESIKRGKKEEDK
jgi:hypothetical protein